MCDDQPAGHRSVLFYTITLTISCTWFSKKIRHTLNTMMGIDSYFCHVVVPDDTRSGLYMPTRSHHIVSSEYSIAVCTSNCSLYGIRLCFYTARAPFQLTRAACAVIDDRVRSVLSATVIGIGEYMLPSYVYVPPIGVCVQLKLSGGHGTIS